MSDKKFDVTGHIIDLSDLFRRKAKFTQQYAAAKLVSISKEIADYMITLEECDYEDLNDTIQLHLLSCMRKLEATAKGADISKITLPFVYQSKHGKWFFNNIVKKFDTDLTVVMLPSLYKSKYTDVGFLDDKLDKKTCLYAGDDIYSYYIEDDEEATLRLIDVDEKTRDNWLEEKFVYI